MHLHAWSYFLSHIHHPVYTRIQLLVFWSCFSRVLMVLTVSKDKCNSCLVVNWGAEEEVFTLGYQESLANCFFWWRILYRGNVFSTLIFLFILKRQAFRGSMRRLLRLFLKEVYTLKGFAGLVRCNHILWLQLAPNKCKKSTSPLTHMTAQAVCSNLLIRPIGGSLIWPKGPFPGQVSTLTSKKTWLQLGKGQG